MKTGCHATIYEKSYFEAIDVAKNNGFEFVQFDLGVPTYFLDNLNDNDLVEIKDYSKDKGMRICFHAPGDNVSLFCDYPKIRKGIIDQFLFILEKANKLGARHITFHTGKYPEFKKAIGIYNEHSVQFADYYMDVLYNNILELIKNTQETLICFENCDFNSLNMKVLETLFKNGKNVYLTLDTAKSYTRKFEPDNSSFQFMKNNSERVREIHIHDLSKEYGSHRIVGDGIVDFSLFKDFLFKDEIFMNFEVRPIQAAKTAKQRLFELFNVKIK